MKALVYHGPGQRSWDEVPDPVIVDPTDAVVRIDSLHDLRYRSAHPQGRRARGEAEVFAGHEAVGTVTAVGAAVTTLVEGRPPNSSPASARADAARFCRRLATASAPVEAAGCSVT